MNFILFVIISLAQSIEKTHDRLVRRATDKRNNTKTFGRESKNSPSI